MASRIEFSAGAEQILVSLEEFNRDAHRDDGALELAWDTIRRTQYWVHDVQTDAFGPSKFVGFVGMTYDRYLHARESGSTGARFDGFQARTAIEKALGRAFGPNVKSAKRLAAWAVALVGPNVFEGVDASKWRFVRLREGRVEVNFAKAWSEWADLNPGSLDRVPETFGGYQFRAVDEKKRPRVIRRCFGDDDEGVLGIGETKSLRRRLRALHRCMSDKDQGGHMAGWRYAYLEMQKIFPLERIQFRYRAVKDDAAAYLLEGELLHAYVGRHYELPPLNYKFNWSVLDEQRAHS